MSLPEDIARFLASFMATMRTESIAWQKEHQEELQQLQMKKAVAEQEIQNRLREMEARFSAHIERIQIEEVRKTANFREFLDEIDGLKAQIAQAFPSMQRTVVLLIHRKATELLVDAWNNPDVVQASLRHEAFLNLMMTVSEELGEIGGAGPTKQLPERTIKLIRHEG